MNKKELIQLLKDYNENVSKLELRKKEKKMIEKRLEADKEIEISITNNYEINNDIKSKNSISDKVGNTAIKIINQNEEDKQRLQELNQIILELESKVEEINIRLKRIKV